MVSIYGWLLVVCALVFFLLGLYAFSTFKRTDGVGRPFLLCIVFSFLTVSCYGAGVLTQGVLAQIFYGCSYALNAWTFVSINRFIVAHARVEKSKPNLKKFLDRYSYIFAALDTFLVIILSFLKKFFECGQTTLWWGESYYGIIHLNKLYLAVHAFILLSSMLFSLNILAWKSAVAAKIYKKKYSILLESILLLIAMDVVNIYFGWKIDFSPLFNIAFCFILCYCYLFFIPKSLSNTLTMSAIQALGDGVICYDKDGKCVSYNRAANVLYKIYPGVTFDGYYQSCFGDKTEEDFFPSAKWSKTHIVDGEERVFTATFNRIACDNQYVGSVFVIHDATEEKMELEKQKYDARHDNLTKLINKPTFCRRVKRRLQEDVEHEYVLAVMNINNFKIINDAFGTSVGDQALCWVADAFRENAFEDSIYGRIQGDIFALMTRKENFSESFYRGIIDKLCELDFANNYRLVVQFGFYPIGDRDTEVEVMIDRAMTAVRSIHDDISEVVSVYDDKMRQKVLDEQSLISDFDEALKNGEFVFYIQPQLDVKKKTVVGGEALVRWISSKKGFISPGDFVPLFERKGIISLLDRYIWEEVCKKLKSWKLQGLTDCCLSVNISPKDLVYFDIYKVFTDLVEEYEISPKNLHLEITESAVIQNLKKYNDLLIRLRQYGFVVEMDDFGSGYSSLNMLKDIVMDTIKLDMGFLRKNEDSEKGRSIVRTVISLAKIMDMEVVCEGVETQEQADFLEEMGCDIFQGYFFGKPMSVDAFEEKTFGRIVR